VLVTGRRTHKGFNGLEPRVDLDALDLRDVALDQSLLQRKHEAADDRETNREFFPLRHGATVVPGPVLRRRLVHWPALAGDNRERNAVDIHVLLRQKASLGVRVVADTPQPSAHDLL